MLVYLVTDISTRHCLAVIDSSSPPLFFYLLIVVDLALMMNKIHLFLVYARLWLQFGTFLCSLYSSMSIIDRLMEYTLHNTYIYLYLRHRHACSICCKVLSFFKRGFILHRCLESLWKCSSVLQKKFILRCVFIEK